MIILFPLGALSMVLFGKTWVHGFIQLVSLGMLVVGFGLGVKLADLNDYVCPLSISLPLLYNVYPN
jgi:hypothetical protein